MVNEFKPALTAEELLIRNPKYDTHSDLIRAHLIVDMSKKGLFTPFDILDEEEMFERPIHDLREILLYGRSFGQDETFLYAPKVVANQCHVVSSFYWVIFKSNLSYNPRPESEPEIYTGLSDNRHLHSWLYFKQNKICLEPTPLIRDAYYGTNVVDPFRFVLEEYNNIQKVIATGVFPKSDVSCFNTEFSNLLLQK